MGQTGKNNGIDDPSKEQTSIHGYSQSLKVGDVIVVGNEEAEPGVGEVVELGDRGFVLVKVFPGSVQENRFRLPQGLASAS